ncbi:predicted protein [Histoplasma capsulatum var. duboisii H88]|uniref:Predicted protein n=1 Tax=Ajellomyces capsulatus (strain H88) TaxID=544711 RepID=F0UJ24_AJEC8|nr:predicted protein [Histoplasma capsulatum var. duboisii H88]
MRHRMSRTPDSGLSTIMFETEQNQKSELSLMLPIERNQKEIRREKNRLAQRRHREAKRKSVNRTSSYDKAHPNQAEESASSRERRISQSPAHNVADPVNFDFFKEIGRISNVVETRGMEREIIDELTNINSTWEPSFFQESSMQSQPSHTTSEAASIPDTFLNIMGDNHRRGGMKDIHQWGSNSNDPYPFGPAVLSTQPDPRLIPVDSLDKIQPPLFSDRRHSQNPDFQQAETSRSPDLKGGVFRCEGTENHDEHQFRTGMDGSDVLDKPLQSLSQEIMTTITDPSGTKTDCCRNKRRRTSDGDGERRLERVLSVVEEVGYESLDAVVAEYYIGQFPKDSLLASEQFHSRTRRLGRLLNQVHQSSKIWSKKEAAGYRDIVIRAAEELFQEEVRSRLRGAIGASPQPRTRASPSFSSTNSPWISNHEDPDILSGSAADVSLNDDRSSAHTAIRDMLHESGLTPVLTKDLSRLQNTLERAGFAG